MDFHEGDHILVKQEFCTPRLGEVVSGPEYLHSGLVYEVLFSNGQFSMAWEEHMHPLSEWPAVMATHTQKSLHSVGT